MSAISPGLWRSSECPGGTCVRHKRLVAREAVAGFAAGALLTGVLAAVAWAAAVLPLSAPPASDRLEPAAQKTYSTELPREWRWSPRGVNVEHMYGRRH
jgi:hypothetical protein